MRPHGGGCAAGGGGGALGRRRGMAAAGLGLRVPLSWSARSNRWCPARRCSRGRRRRWPCAGRAPPRPRRSRPSRSPAACAASLTSRSRSRR
eukprot:6234162-Prymnesium_polylepis.1